MRQFPYSCTLRGGTHYWALILELSPRWRSASSSLLTTFPFSGRTSHYNGQHTCRLVIRSLPNVHRHLSKP